MEQIMVFNKTFQDRLTEYQLVFGDTKLASITEIKKQWSLYLELELDAAGWQAFWKIPHSICRKNHVAYPTIVLVQVNEVDYNELNAFVEIVATQGDDVHLENGEFTASLIHLWPTKQQPHGLDAAGVANTLDKLRFFYNHVLMPWDYLDSIECDGNVNERLEFYYNVKENIIAKCKTVKVRALLKQIQNEFEHFDDRVNLKLDPSLVELNTKIIELKLEYELLQMLPMEQKLLNNISSSNNWLIFPNKCTLKDHMEYLESIKYLSQNKEKYQTAISLESALENALCHDVIFINPGNHSLNLSGLLKDGAVLKSVSNDPSKTILDTNKENALLEFMGDKLSIENVHLNVSSARCAIIAHCGQIALKNCLISGHPAAEHAIIALPDANVILENCQISGFNVGLHASNHSHVNLTNCSVSHVANAIKLFDQSRVSLVKCHFENVARTCIYFETKNEDSRTGDETILKSNPCVTIKDCKFENNSTIVVIGNKEDIFDADI